MRTSSVALVLAVAVCTAGNTPLSAQKPASVSTPGLAWEVDLTAAHAASAQDGKPVVAYFTFET